MQMKTHLFNEVTEVTEVTAALVAVSSRNPAVTVGGYRGYKQGLHAGFVTHVTQTKTDWVTGETRASKGCNPCNPCNTQKQAYLT